MSSLLKTAYRRFREKGICEVVKLSYQRIKYYLIDIPSAKHEENKRIKQSAQRYYAHKLSRFFLRNISFLINLPKIIRYRNSRILVVVHLFYMESTDEIIEYLKNLKGYKYDLVISYVDGFYEEESLAKITKFNHSARLIKGSNKGYDIGPFIDIISKTDLKKYDIIIKLQSKGTKRDVFIYDQFMRDRDWFKNLWNGVIGCFSIHSTISKLSKKSEYGLAAAKNLIVHDPKHKQQLVQQILQKQKKIEYIENYYFVAGSCFAIKSEPLEKIKSLGLKSDDFEDTKGGFFSLAHVIERAVCFSIMPEYKFWGNKVDFWRKLKWYRAEKTLRRMSVLNQIDALGKFDIPPEFAWQVLEHCYAKSVKLENIKLGSIKREHPVSGRIIKLEECEPYLYLIGGKKNIETYKKYCSYHKNENGLSNMTIERYKKLIKSIEDNGYDETVPIIVDQNNIICDGQHRACILMNKYGKEHKIQAIKMDLVAIDPGKIRPLSKKVPFIEAE